MNPKPRSEELSPEERIRLLEAENEILHERAEDVLLLGLVAETITPLRDIDAIIETLLERVGILYEIPYCAFARIDGPSPVFRQEFVPHADHVEGSFLRLAPQAIEALGEGALVCSADNAEDEGVELRLRDVKCNQILLIPCSCRSQLSGVFIFAHDSSDSTILVRKLIVLEQVTGLATARMDNIHLLDELKHLNVDLETRVNERTVELHRAARALEIEIAERRRAEEVVAGERHRLRTVVEHLPEGVIVLDAEHRVVLVNHADRPPDRSSAPSNPVTNSDPSGGARWRTSNPTLPSPSGWRSLPKPLPY